MKSTLLNHATQRQQYLANNKFSFYRKAKIFYSTDRLATMGKRSNYLFVFC